MDEQRAKEVIRSDPTGSIAERLEAIQVAREVLGEDCTMADIWRWVDDSKGISTAVQRRI